MDLGEVGWEGVEWMHVAQDSYQGLAVVNMVKNLLGSIKSGDFLTN
jgi:hypothetical protein